MNRTRSLLACTLLMTVSSSGQMTAVIDSSKGIATVSDGSKVFTILHYTGHSKPILFPVNGPHQMSMTRHWPIEAARPGEEKDHPHHESLWFNHGDVNGVDFWKVGATAGKIMVEGMPLIETADGRVALKTKEIWQAPDGKKVCTSQTTITCGHDESDRCMDYRITIHASQGDVTFGDTKEGTMGLRSHPLLNLKGDVAKGHAVNSEGEKDDAIWGRHAKWVDYFAPTENGMVGIACFDHPKNLRHPTTWHARDYGLIAANPFGLHDFEKLPKGAGEFTLQKGGHLTLTYRWLFHKGDATTAKISERWTKWAGQ